MAGHGHSSCFPFDSPPPPIPTTAVKSSLLFGWSWRVAQRGLSAEGCSSQGRGNIWSFVSAPALLLRWRTKKITAIKEEQPEHLLKRHMHRKSWLVPTSELRTVSFPPGSLCLMSSCNSGSWAPSLPLFSPFSHQVSSPPCGKMVCAQAAYTTVLIRNLPLPGVINGTSVNAPSKMGHCKHQVRVEKSSLNCPLANDLLAT